MTTNSINKNVNDIIRDGVMKSLGVSLIPIPLVDFLALSSVQLKMIRKLAEQYHVPYSSFSVKRLISSLIGTSVKQSLFLPVASMIKTIPGIGTSIGTVSMAVTGGAATFSIGKVFANHFEKGGNFGTFNSNILKEQFEAHLKEGVEVAKNLQNRDLVM